MRILTLYRGAGVSFSPVNAEGRTESGYVRLVAEDGMVLTYKNDVVSCIDVAATDADRWEEIPSADNIGPAEALEILLGGDGT